MGRYDYSGFARGWFVVSFSEELAPGDIKPVKYFGKDLVLFRTDAGEARMLDAYCPHMGAHLGHGGKVEGDSVRCPFHAWKFDGAGTCTEIPYATKIPKKAKIKSWLVREKNGMIYVWHDWAGASEPDWEIPDLGGWGTDAWTGWSHGMITVKTQPREIVENVVDNGHFIPVHGTHIDNISNEFDRHIAVQINDGVAYPVNGGKDEYALRATYYGPAFQVTQMEGVLHSRLVNAHTPIDADSLELRFAVSLKDQGENPRSQKFLDIYADNLREGFFQDIRIWENKKFRDTPVLCDGDGPIIQLRTWYKQFFEASA
jgi:3-ketosteroid 9alpha-monooxygenase subunit A